MNAFRLGHKSTDHKEILVTPQGIGGDKPGIHKRGFAHVPVKAWHLDDVVVRKLVARHAGDRIGKISRTVENEVRLLSNVLSERAADMRLDLNDALSCRVDR